MKSGWIWWSDLRLVISTTVRGLVDDPLQFLVQVARRLKLVRVPNRERPTVVNAYAWFLADRPDKAARILAALPPQQGLMRRAARRLGVQLGALRSDASDPSRLQWLDLTQVGDLTAALEAAPAGSAARKRTHSELDLLRPCPRPSHHTGRNGPALFVLTNSLPYTHSGYTLRSQSILQALTDAGAHAEAATRIGYPTTIGAPGAPPNWFVDGVRYHRLSAPRLPVRLDARLEEQRRLLQELAGRLRPGVLHCTTDYTNAIVTRDISHDLKLPWVYEMRGQLELSWVASRPASLKDDALTSERVRLLRAKETELACDANAVIVLSEVQKQDLVTRGVAAEKITVVPNAVAETLLDEYLVPAEARSSLGLPSEGFWVGAVSSLVAYEGFDVLLRAVKGCRDAGLDVRCAIVGDGVSRPQLVGLAERLGIADYCHLPGRVARAEAIGWTQALDAVVIPRLDTPVTRMVTPMKIIEAMALARPVITSALPALEELVSIPGSGIVFPPGDDATLVDQITLLAANAEARDGLAYAGRRFAASRTWQNAAQQILSIYERECDAEIG